MSRRRGPASHPLIPIRARATALLVGLGILGAALPVAAERQGADHLRAAISLRFPGTEWVSRESLVDWMEAPQSPPLILVDVRSEDEFEVSHLAGSVRVDPATDAESLPTWPKDARIVVYCSVGYRSAALAKRIEKAGYGSVFNLQGGLFGWANAGRPLFRGSEPAERVHPYDDIWGRFLDERFHP